MVWLQVCMAADDCLASLLPQQPAAVCLTLLKANLPAQGTVNTPACQPTAFIQVGHDAHAWSCWLHHTTLVFRNIGP